MTTMDVITEMWDWRSPAWVTGSVAAIVYSVLVGRRARSGQWVSFAAAALTFILATASPIGVLAASYLFSAHMLQHMLLLLVAPALLLLAIPRRRGGFPLPTGMIPVLWSCGIGAMWFWHVPVLCDASLRSNAVYVTQVVSLMLAGTAFWWPIFSPNLARRLAPPHAAAYLFTACVGCTLLGIFVTFSPLAVCSLYHHPADPYGVLPLIRNGWGLSFAADQELGGLLMWVPACAIYVAAIMAMMRRWYRADASVVSLDTVVAGADR